MFNKARVVAFGALTALLAAIAAPGQHSDTDWRVRSADREAAAAGGDFVLRGGFWQLSGPCNSACVQDIDGSGDVRVPDLIKLLSCL